MSTASIIASIASRNNCSPEDIVSAARVFDETGEPPGGSNLTSNTLAMVISIGGLDTESTSDRPEIESVEENVDIYSPPTTPIPIIKRQISKPPPGDPIVPSVVVEGEDEATFSIYEKMSRERGLVLDPEPMDKPLFITGRKTTGSFDTYESLDELLGKDIGITVDAPPTVVHEEESPEPIEVEDMEDVLVDEVAVEDVSVDDELTFSPFVLQGDPVETNVVDEVVDQGIEPLGDWGDTDELDVEELSADPVPGDDVGDFLSLGEVVDVDEDDYHWSPSDHVGESLDLVEDGYSDDLVEDGYSEEPIKEKPDHGPRDKIVAPTFDEIVSGENVVEEEVATAPDSFAFNRLADEGRVPLSDFDEDLGDTSGGWKKWVGWSLVAILVLLVVIMGVAMFFGYSFHDIFGVGYEYASSPIEFLKEIFGR